MKFWNNINWFTKASFFIVIIVSLTFFYFKIYRQDLFNNISNNNDSHITEDEGVIKEDDPLIDLSNSLGSNNLDIFRNEKYGFEFAYPIDIPLARVLDGFSYYIYKGDLSSEYNKIKASVSDDKRYKCDVFSIRLADTSTQAFKKVCRFINPGYRDSEFAFYYYAGLPDNNIFFMSSYGSPYSDFQEFDKIFSESFSKSFRIFTPERAGWLVYKNDTYGFEFKYNSDLHEVFSRGGVFSLKLNHFPYSDSEGYEGYGFGFGIKKIVKVPSDWDYNRHDAVYINKLFDDPYVAMEEFDITDSQSFGFDTINFNLPREGDDWIIEHNGFLYLFFGSREFLSDFKFTK